MSSSDSQPTDLRRYSAFRSGGQVGLWESKDGEWVLYTDYLAALAEEREACAQEAEAFAEVGHTAGWKRAMSVMAATLRQRGKNEL